MDYDVEAFVKAYIEAALWSSSANGYVTDDGTFVPDENVDKSFLDLNFDPDDIAPEAYVELRRDCIAFIEDNLDELRAASTTDSRYTAGSAGHDFWLTRNGHGAGFWDRGLGEIGDTLSTASKAYGSADLYVGDDGKVWV